MTRHGTCSNKPFSCRAAACWCLAPRPRFSSGGVWGGRGPPATREVHARVSLSGLLLLLLLRRFSRVRLCATPPGSSVPGILQARTLEWVAIAFSNACKGKVKVKMKSLSHVWLLATPWTAAHQAPLSMGFSKQEYWSGVPFIVFSEYNTTIG